jgi:hypothetical protein
VTGQGLARAFPMYGSVVKYQVGPLVVLFPSEATIRQ